MAFYSAVKDNNIDVERGSLLRPLTTYNLGGYAEFLIKPKTVKELIKVIDLCKKYNQKYYVLGKGSNLLIADGFVRGAFILTKNLGKIYFSSTEVLAECGAFLKTVIDSAERVNLYGLENLSGIPASIGGALMMNASAFNKSIGDLVKEVLIYKDGKVLRLNRQECGFLYRKSDFENCVILSATFSLTKEQPKIKAEEYLKKRQLIQPKGRSCGSVFKNPDGDFAGRLIDGLSLKGLNYNGACISKKHANFIINNGATAKDVYELIKYVKRRVKEKYNVNLDEEVIYIGEFDDFNRGLSHTY